MNHENVYEVACPSKFKKAAISKHFKQRLHFSGGWVATRASGMKKNLYGNIEDIVLNVKVVTSVGVYHQKQTCAQKITGPSLDDMIFGSEGTFGAITEVEVKIHLFPKVRRYGSIVFPNFSYGIQYLREIAKRRCQPASIRLMDNDQFHFGQALKTDEGTWNNFTNDLKKFLLTKVKGYDWNEIAVITILFEGSQEEVDRHEKLIFSIAKQFYGLNGGSKNGEKGYVSSISTFKRGCGAKFRRYSAELYRIFYWKCLRNFK